MSAPTLGLPNVSKPFFLFSYQTQGTALRILTQNLSPYQSEVAYFSKQLNATTKDWSRCLQTITTIVLNIQKALKFALNQKITVLVSHSVRSAGSERWTLTFHTKIPKIPSHYSKTKQCKNNINYHCQSSFFPQ
ncbi:hypothetical protein Nmel_000527 [Mimus melanotis]